MAETTYAFPLDLIAPADGQHSRRSEASMVALRDGSVLLAYARHTGPNDPGYARLVHERIARYAGGSPIERDNDFGEIVAVRLGADARPIDPERVIVPAPANGLNSMSPALRRLPDGRLGLLYSYRESTRVASRRFVASDDDGQTWSRPVMVLEGGYRTGCHDRFTVLSGGRLIAPCHGGDDFDNHYRKIWVAWSDDQGATWQHGTSLELPQLGWPGATRTESGCNEPGVVERADGSLFMTMRTAMGTQFCAESHDRGETWSSPRSLTLISPSAPAHLSRLPDSDDLLIIWTQNYDSRVPMYGDRHTLCAAISHDGGATWPYEHRRVLVHDSSRNTDYPAVFYRGSEAWIALRQSNHPRVIQGRMSTGIMRVPIPHLYG